MRYVTFSTTTNPTRRVGVLVPLGNAPGTHTHVVDLSAAFEADGGAPLTGGMRGLLASLDTALPRTRTAASSGQYRTEISGATLHAPISDPEKIICVGMNYFDHCAEIGVAVPKEPVLFSKFASSITGPGCPIPLDEELVKELDFEVELCIVIGKTGRHIRPEEALDHIAGWTVAHDVSARDLQLKRNGGQWLLGKTGDGHAPIGPSIVTRDEGPAFSDACALDCKCFVNGTRMQSSNTRELIFKPIDILVYASSYFTLNPGDLIFTGTPGGVGVFRKPPLFLKDGDECVVEIDGLGSLTNTVRATKGGNGSPAAKRAKL